MGVPWGVGYLIIEVGAAAFENNVDGDIPEA
jgi:hypothetical protein